MRNSFIASILITTTLATGLLVGPRSSFAQLPDDDLLPGETTISLKTKDNKAIAASLYYPTAYLEGDNGAREKKYPAAILIHSWLRDRSDWVTFVPYLQKAGYAVISIDLRNHGLSDGKNSWHDASYSHLVKMPHDARAAYDYISKLEFIDTKRIILMGVSIGTIIAAHLCRDIDSSLAPPIYAMVLVSPAGNYFGVSSSLSIAQSTSTPILFVVDRQDPSPKDNKVYTSGLNLYKKFKGQKQLLEYNGTGHGNKMIRSESFPQNVLDWLKSLDTK